MAKLQHPVRYKITARLHLYVEVSGNAPTIAGGRLERGTPLPIDSFDFEATDLEGAEKAGKRLEAYLNNHEKTKA